MKKTLLTLFAITFVFSIANAQVSAYPFASTSGTYTAITAGTLLGSVTDDDQRFVDPASPLGGTILTGVGLPIGFNFTYNGIVFDKLAINSNGWISLGQSSLTPSVDINSSSSYNTLSATSTATPTLLRNRIAAFALDLEAQTGSSLRLQTTGSTPNRICVVQWANYTKYGETDDSFNFQIRLKETSNTVEIVYGTVTNGATAESAQVGLGGTLVTDFNVRTTTTNWAATTAATVNTAECDLSATVKPASGLTYTWSTPAACTGTPTAGTASGPTGACTGVAFNLVLTGYTSGVSGITFQWQSSTSIGGTYTNISGATTSTFSTTQTATMYYKCLVSCSGGTAVASNIVTIPMNTFVNCYCAAVSGGSACITNVTVGTLNRTSAACENSPTYYTAVPVGTATATLNKGVSYPLSVTNGGTGAAIISVWIDYNQSGTYEASEWTQVTTNALALAASTVTILIPTSATLGQTGMRIRSRSTGSPNGSGDACIEMFSGETEDYVVTIGTGTPCAGTPTAGTASGPTAVCSGESFNLVLTGYTSGVTGITLQWQSSSTIGGTYTNISGATNSTYAATLTATTYYKCLVTCSGGTPVASNIVTVTLNAPSACYCTPATSNCATTDKITNVTIGSINNTTTCGTNGYTSYTTPTTTLNTSIAYPISVIVGSTSQHVGVWIDYNQNGTFETTEFTYVGTGNTTLTSTITIPGTATLGATKMRVRARWSSTLTGADACLAYTYGETEDYAITIGLGAACSGTPTAGTASGPTGACSGTSFNLVLTGYTSGVSGITLQWQSSSTIGGTYTNISGATSATYAATITATTYYKCLVTCSGGTPVASNIVTVTLSAPSACYCTPATSNCATTDKITNVTIGSINNTTTCGTNGYTLYTTPTATFNQGISYPVSVIVGATNQHVGVWIDYNQNGTFETSEFTYVGTGTTTITSAIVIPGAATLGATRMRVRARYSSILTGADACLAYTYGETEDYVVTIAAGIACTGTPTAGTATSSTDSICNGVDFNLVLTGYTSGVAGITFQWQSSSTLGGTYTDIAGATTSTYAASQTATTYYKCIVTCNSGTPVASNVVTVYSIPLMDCYCVSTATSASDEDIFNVTVGTLNNTSSCTTTGGAGSVLKMYSNYTAVAAPNLGRTLAIPFSVQIGTCGTGSYKNAFKIYIDYNQNGSFEDAGENVYSSDTAQGPQTKTGSFTVPSTAGIGNTVMRVVCKETSDTSTIESCGTYSYGETEDYLVNITSMSGIDENTISGIIIYPNPTTGVFNIATGNANFTELTISVFDIQGKEVFNTIEKNNSSEFNKQINLEGLTNGIYYIRINTGAGVKTQKLIIQ